MQRPLTHSFALGVFFGDRQLDSVKVVRHKRTTFSDKVASFMVAISRRGFDLITGYKVGSFPIKLPYPLFSTLLKHSQHASPEDARRLMEMEGLTKLPLSELRKRGFVMGIEQWMIRILFLETIAGVPGMVSLVGFIFFHRGVESEG